MILGYILLGWLGGFLAACWILMTGAGWLAAFGAFVLVGNAVVLMSAALVHARAEVRTRADDGTALSAPVPSLTQR
jgi:hypothetical protein